MCYVTSLQEAIALHNISPKTVAEKQTEQESSGRPGNRSRSKPVKDIRRKVATGVWRLWDRVKVVLCSEGFAARWTKGTDKELCFIHKVN